MKHDLLKVSLRQGAVFVPKKEIRIAETNITDATTEFVFNLGKLSYTLSEELLHVLNNTDLQYRLEVYDLLKDILGINLNWAPLVKGWDLATGESFIDHLNTFFANIFENVSGDRLPCGHLIPKNTFPLERYNGCPFCGTPFILAQIENITQGSNLNVLELWTEEELNDYYHSLLQSRTALDTTQVDSLRILLKFLPIPDVEILMKETQLLVTEAWVEKGEYQKASRYFTTPNDILRYLWYRKTGFLQIIEPKVIIRREAKNSLHIISGQNDSQNAGIKKKEELKLKYTRQECRMVAGWLNELCVNIAKACELMHPKRNMWVRFIRALRLAEYAKKAGFENLRKLLDVFYRQTYPVYQGMLDQYRLKSDAINTFNLLIMRPGLFARSLFANMLWFGPDVTLTAFRNVIDQVPARLLFTLSMYADDYFNPNHRRVVKPLGSTSKVVNPNKLLSSYTKEELKRMVEQVEEVCVEAVSIRFKKIPTTHKTMYIDPVLYHIPLPIGDRAETVQDLSATFMGMRFPVEGNTVRLFMQWGKGLSAQHMDMDLSCHITLPDRIEVCSFNNLTATGAKHSGDIRQIPYMVGTAEYIDINLDELTDADAKYVVFACNAYSLGGISPNMVVGWMNSAYPMSISPKTGVAYDPSCVQHQVRITQHLTKGLVFGILEIATREIIWMELPFDGQTIFGLNMEAIESMLNKLNSKITIGRLLRIKAEAQGMKVIETEDAEEIYSLKWAANMAEVSRLLID